MKNVLFTKRRAKYFWTKPHQEPVCIHKSWHCLSGAIERALYITVFCNTDKNLSWPDRFSAEIDEKRPEMDKPDARPHVSLQRWQKFEQLSCYVLLHSPYASDLSSIYHLFRSIQYVLKWKYLNSPEVCKNQDGCHVLEGQNQKDASKTAKGNGTKCHKCLCVDIWTLSLNLS